MGKHRFLSEITSIAPSNHGYRYFRSRDIAMEMLSHDCHYWFHYYFDSSCKKKSYRCCIILSGIIHFISFYDVLSPHIVESSLLAH